MVIAKVAVANRIRRSAFVFLVGVCIAGCAESRVFAQTLEAALATAYTNNPTLNAQRAGTRAADEKVPQALSGFRPTLQASAQGGSQYYQYQSTGSGKTSTTRQELWPRSFALTAAYTLFDGFGTANKTLNAEAQVRGSRETLRNTEQTVLLNGVTAYMNVLQTIALLDLQRRSLAAYEQELRATRDRFNVGEVTRTDVAQAEARVADAQYQLSQAVANLSSARAVYRQVIGVEPGKLYAPRSVEGSIPGQVERVISSGLNHHPAVRASEYAVDAAAFQVKVAEAALMPNVSLQGQASQVYDTVISSTPVEAYGVATGTLNLSAPIYQGGGEYANIRKAKALLSQARIEVDVNRDTVRAQAVQYWGALEASKAQTQAAQASVAANTLALEGVREEWRVGQRTTTDVLNAQRDLTNAQSSLVIAKRDQVVAAYSLISVTGKLDAMSLGLKVNVYDPTVHYQKVRDSWTGVRTPDGQ